jgi:hypothetical protein
MSVDEETIIALRSIFRGMVTGSMKKIGKSHSQEDTILRKLRHVSSPAVRKKVDKFMKKCVWLYYKPSDGEKHCSIYPEQQKNVHNFLSCSMSEAIEIVNNTI